MPEYRYPGVYVEEINTRPKSIAGVSTSTLAFELREIVQRIQPDWTDRNTSDPGVTILEVLAWLSDTLVYRGTAVPEQGRRAAMRTVATLSALAGSCGPASGPVTRPHFFASRLLDAAILQAEQNYHREKQRRHNLALHGFGIVGGFEVRVEATVDPPDDRVHVNPGHAIDSRGEDISLSRCVIVALPQTPKEIFVSIRHQDIPCWPVLSPAGESAFSQVEEACVVALAGTVEEPAIALARLVHLEGRWAVDRSFVRRCLSRGSR